MTDKNAGSEQTDNTVSILDTFSRVMAAKSSQGVDPAKNLRSKLKAAMAKNDQLVESFFTRKRAHSDNQSVINSNREQDVNKKS